MPSVYGAQVASVFHKTLGAIWDDGMAASDPSWKEYLDEKSTTKRFYDDVEMVDPGLWGEVDEGNDINLDQFAEGVITRYRPIKFGQRLVIPEEIEEDAEYEQAYDAVKKMTRTCVQTQNYDAAALLDDAFTASGDTPVGGDGKEMCATDHPLRGGATVSNELDPALSPSNSAVQVMLVACEKMPGTNGHVSSIRLIKLFGPSDHKFRFKEILKSEKKDNTSNNAINALKGELSDQYGSVPEMASTTNWFGKTNAMRGGMFIWRRKPRFRNENSYTNETKVYTGSARWTKGYSNFRWVIGSAS